MHKLGGNGWSNAIEAEAGAPGDEEVVAEPHAHIEVAAAVLLDQSCFALWCGVGEGDGKQHRLPPVGSGALGGGGDREVAPASRGVGQEEVGANRQQAPSWLTLSPPSPSRRQGFFFSRVSERPRARRKPKKERPFTWANL